MDTNNKIGIWGYASKGTDKPVDSAVQPESNGMKRRPGRPPKNVQRSAETTETLPSSSGGNAIWGAEILTDTPAKKRGRKPGRKPAVPPVFESIPEREEQPARGKRESILPPEMADLPKREFKQTLLREKLNALREMRSEANEKYKKAKKALKKAKKANKNLEKLLVLKLKAKLAKRERDTVRQEYKALKKSILDSI